METHISLSKLFTSRTTPLSSLLSNNPTDSDTTDDYVLNILKRSNNLKEECKDISDLWKQKLVAKASHDQKLLVIITESHRVLMFNLHKNSIKEIKLPLLKGITCFDIFLHNNKLIITALFQILIVDLDTLKSVGIEYFNSSGVITFSFPLTMRTQKKYLKKWKALMDVPKTDCSGDFHINFFHNQQTIQGIVGILYTSSQFPKAATINHIMKNFKSKSSLKSKENHCILYLTKVTYYDQVFHSAHNKVMKLDYYLNIDSVNTLKSLLIIRTDRDCESIVVILNSSNKYHSQMLLFDYRSTVVKQLRITNFLSKIDKLSANTYEETKLVALDARWSPNKLFVVILFSFNYFCIISRLGHLLNLLYNNSNIHFFVLPYDIGSYYNLKVTERQIELHYSDCVTIVEYSSKLSPHDLWKIDTTQQPSNIIKFMLSFPELTVESDMIDALRRNIKNNLLCSVQPKDNLNSRENEAELTADVMQALKCSFSAVGAVRWLPQIQENTSRAIRIMFNDLFELLCKKSDPLYLVNLLEILRKSTIEPKLEDIIFYNTVKDFKNSIVSSYKNELNLEKEKALIMFYFYSQFRNSNAPCYNILYLIRVSVLKERYKENKRFNEAIYNIVSLATFSLSRHKKKQKNHNITNSSITMIDIEPLQKLILDLYGNSVIRYNQPVTNNKEQEPKENQQPPPFMETLINYYNADVMEIIHEMLKLFIKEESKAQNKLSAIIHSKTQHINYIYTCIKLIEEGNYNEVFKNIQELVDVAIAAGRLTSNASNNQSLILAIVYTYLLVTALTILKCDNTYTINIREVHNLLYKVLNHEDPLIIFEQLKRKIKINEKYIIKESVNSKLNLYIAVGILFQLSEDIIAINILLDSSIKDLILLGLFILNNTINESCKFEKLQLGKKCIQIIIKSIPQILNVYLKNLVSNTNGFAHIFSVCMFLGSKLTDAILTYKLLPWFVINLQKLFNTSAIKSSNILKSVDVKKTISDVCPCLALNKFTCLFYQCSNESFKFMFAKYFDNSTQAIIFNTLFQEVVQILCSCLALGIFKFSPSNSDILRVSKVFPAMISDSMKALIDNFITLLWKISLLFLIEQLKESKHKPCALTKIMLGSTLLRLSSISNTEQQELEFIQCGLSQLKEIDYATINLAEIKGELKELGSALDLYVNKYENIVRRDKDAILIAIKTSNPTAYSILKTHMPNRNRIVNKPEVDLKKNVKMDALYKKMLECFKQTLLWMQEKGSVFRILVEKGEIVRETFRDVLKNINRVSGIPSSMVIVKEGNKWDLAVAMIFQKTNDKLIDNFKTSIILNDVLGNNEIEIDNTSDNPLNYYYSILYNSIGTWRINGEKGNVTLLNCFRIDVLNHNSFFHRKLKKDRKSTPETIMILEKAINSLTDTLKKLIKKQLSKMKQLRFTSVLEVHVKSLIPDYGRRRKRQSSIPLVIKNNEAVRPFIVYHISKTQLGEDYNFIQNTKTNKRISTEVFTSQETFDNAVNF